MKGSALPLPTKLAYDTGHFNTRRLPRSTQQACGRKTTSEQRPNDVATSEQRLYDIAFGNMSAGIYICCIAVSNAPSRHLVAKRHRNNVRTSQRRPNDVVPTSLSPKFLLGLQASSVSHHPIHFGAYENAMTMMMFQC